MLINPWCYACMMFRWIQISNTSLSDDTLCQHNDINQYDDTLCLADTSDGERPPVTVRAATITSSSICRQKKFKVYDLRSVDI